MDEGTECRWRDTGIDDSDDWCSSLTPLREALLKCSGVMDQIRSLEAFDSQVFDAERASVGSDESVVITSTERDDHWSHEDGIYRSRLHSCCDE